MPVILPVKGVMPQIPDSCFVAPNATIVGDVVMGEECSVWFNAVVRGDVNSIDKGCSGQQCFHRPQCHCPWLHRGR
jgi:carbonic anhydrase/acetyltransferase-like protein (isoleucine patch superfamily)